MLKNDPDIQSLRAFNRFYTQRADILEPYLGSDFSLTEARVMYGLAGREVFAPLEQKSCASAAALFAALTPDGRTQLVNAMACIQKLLSPEAEKSPATRVLVLRDPVPGDMGWVV